MRVEVVPATAADASRLWANLRSDQMEMEDVSGASERDLQAQINASAVAFVGRLDDEPVVIWGVLMPSLTCGMGVIWALTSKAIDRCPLVFVRRSKIELEKVRQNYTELTGFVATEYEVSAKWLRWLGFKISPSYTFHGRNVRRISMGAA